MLKDNVLRRILPGKGAQAAAPKNQAAQASASCSKGRSRCTRPLCAGTLLGSGTVSHSRYREVGSCCISERRAIEMIDHDGVASTPFLRFGERVRMLAVGDEPELPLFGVLDQTVVPPSAPDRATADP